MGDPMSDVEFECGFCGRLIEPVGYDPCSLLLTTHYLRDDRRQEEQTLFSHAACLRERVQPSVPLAVLEPDIFEP